ncbi:MAG: PRC-barrel domain containing protein [Sphaerobacteraceae bacterium]|nr:MAG: PRC-barrel domain containing protein [Sphaerobacteraceae bacterium]
MNQMKPRARSSWQDYLGRDVYTADNQQIGLVVDVRTDPQSRELYLIVQDSADPSAQPLCIPAEAVGVATRFRLMLDLVSDRLPKDEWSQLDFRVLHPA